MAKKTITAQTPEFITLEELKKHLNIPAAKTVDHVELELARGSAEEGVEFLVGPVIHATVTETVHPSRSGVAVLAKCPVVSVTSVLSNGVSVTHALNAEAGIISGLPWAGDLVVTYTVGRTVLPDSIRLAALIIAAHLWDTQRGPATSPLQEEETTEVPGLGYAVPNRALELLAPYLLAPAVG